MIENKRNQLSLFINKNYSNEIEWTIDYFDKNKLCKLKKEFTQIKDYKRFKELENFWMKRSMMMDNVYIYFSYGEYCFGYKKFSKNENFIKIQYYP